MKCVAPECGNLCYHLYKCDSLCYDYANGHICKHLHRVHSMTVVAAEAVVSTETDTAINTEISAETDTETGVTSYHLPQKSGTSSSGIQH